MESFIKGCLKLKVVINYMKVCFPSKGVFHEKSPSFKRQSSIKNDLPLKVVFHSVMDGPTNLPLKIGQNATWNWAEVELTGTELSNTKFICAWLCFPKSCFIIQGFSLQSITNWSFNAFQALSKAVCVSTLHSTYQINIFWCY